MGSKKAQKAKLLLRRVAGVVVRVAVITLFDATIIEQQEMCIRDSLTRGIC